MRLTGLGYEIERGESGQPEIRGYTPEYLEASSPRRQQIQEHLEAAPAHGAAAAQIAAHQTREGQARPLARRGAAARIARWRRRLAISPRTSSGRRAAASPVGPRIASPRITARTAVTFAKERNLEREAVVDERAVLRDALTRSMGEVHGRRTSRPSSSSASRRASSSASLGRRVRPAGRSRRRRCSTSSATPSR